MPSITGDTCPCLIEYIAGQDEERMKGAEKKILFGRFLIFRADLADGWELDYHQAGRDAVRGIL